MYSFKQEDKLPVHAWIKKGTIEEGALKQIENLASLPFAFKHIAIMPDCHQGYGMPIGSVLATEGVIVPNAVGVDIGCGMCASPTNIPISYMDSETLKLLMGEIRKKIPVGFAHREEVLEYNIMPPFSRDFSCVITSEFDNALKSLGTLGGGNHFIEIQSGSDGFIWVMIHSGSRNLGKKVADHYNKIAKNLNEIWHSKVPSEFDLAFLPLDCIEGIKYMKEMEYCVEFAKANRKTMMDIIMESIADCLCFTNLHYGPCIDIAHNYARMENHFDANVMVHRKGATSAKAGEIGIIPGSQGTASYIVRGKGNLVSFQSCSHGAGRCMGRKEAIRTLDLKAEIKRLDDLGIIHAIRNSKDLEEAPSAYKDIVEVMEFQKDLVDIIFELKPLAVIKG